MPKNLTYQQQLARAMSERELARNVENLATARGWKHYSVKDTVHPAIRTSRGFPDFLAIKGNRQIVAEFKRQGKDVTPEQLEWLDAFLQAGVEIFLWKPPDWLDGTIERELSR